jgi:hypothetical protein
MKMKNKFVIGIIAMFSMSSYVMADSEREEICSALSKQASTIMFIRQLTVVPIVDALNNVPKHAVELARQLNLSSLDALNTIPKHAPDSFKKQLTTITIEAYKSPLFSTYENREIAITEFGNKIYLECISN